MTDKVKLTNLSEEEIAILEKGWFYDLGEDIINRFGGYDFISMYQNNFNHPVNIKDIRMIKEVIPTYNDGPKAIWIVWAYDGRTWYVEGACDYTGWDCQSWCSWFELPKTDSYDLDYIEKVINGTN